MFSLYPCSRLFLHIFISLLLRFWLVSLVSVFVAIMPQWLRVRLSYLRLCRALAPSLYPSHYNLDLISDSLDTACMYISLGGFSLECIVDLPL